MDLIIQNGLTYLIMIPVLACVVLMFMPRGLKELAKTFTLGVMVLQLGLSLAMYGQFQNTGVIDQFMVKWNWIPQWNIFYHVGVDGVSLLLIVLSTITVPMALIGTWNSVESQIKMYLVCLLGLQATMIGVFAAVDVFLFYVFWEVMLVPMYFLIGIWGGENRVHATVKFFIYTMAGSVVMLVALLYMYFKAGTTFDLLTLQTVRLGFSAQVLVFLAMALAFAIKVPLFPFHTWLPDAHVQAPTAGSVILAGVLLKMGTYGFYRFALPLFPDAVVFLKPYLMGLAVVGIVYGALVAMIQPDIKKLVAYSSVSHMGVVMLGLFSLEPTAMTGGLYQMFNHAVSTGGLFLLIGMLYDRTHTRQIADYSGLAHHMPVFTVFFLIVTMSSIGVPLTNGFVGEFLTLLGTYKASPIMAAVGTTGVVLGAVYMLWMVERVFFGEPKHTHGVDKDLNLREVLVMSSLVIAIFWMGIAPQPFLGTLEKPTLKVLEMMQSGDRVVPQVAALKVN